MGEASPPHQWPRTALLRADLPLTCQPRHRVTPSLDISPSSQLAESQREACRTQGPGLASAAPHPSCDLDSDVRIKALASLMGTSL